ncbi:hypothetical protein GCM10011401_06410 [Nesterenkonia cremea]|uniref:Uncharacterized protein n=1 Tax=Nesterenkonia cremea TaxID=1882340 RepID=A0A917EMR8_9MICC|nr:hypothetical protein GCM10011401_06410 [Nesterenkonia cremea]
MGRARPVHSTNWASEAGPASRASRIITDLSMTPIPEGEFRGRGGSAGSEGGCEAEGWLGMVPILLRTD